MGLYLVTYDLNKSDKDYEGLTKELQSFAGYNHCQKSVWLIISDASATGIFDRLKPHIDGNDHILILRWSNEYQGWMPENVWKWIHDHGY